jgi:hypothetical protein
MPIPLLFRHFKPRGKTYQVLASGALAVESNESLIVYQELIEGGVWIRSPVEFFGNVVFAGVEVPRFMPLNSPAEALREKFRSVCAPVVTDHYDAAGNKISPATKKTTIATSSGKLVDPFALEIEDLDVLDIAYALAHQNRYGGHAGQYSVAEHCVLVSLEAERRGRERGYTDALTMTLAKEGLAHDMEEAYLPDMSRPVKRRPDLAAYGAAGKKNHELIRGWLGLSGDYPEFVEQIDTQIIGTEAPELFARIPEEWHLPAVLQNVRVRGLNPERARATFLRRFCELWPERDLGPNRL